MSVGIHTLTHNGHVDMLSNDSLMAYLESSRVLMAMATLSRGPLGASSVSRCGFYEAHEGLTGPISGLIGD